MSLWRVMHFATRLVKKWWKFLTTEEMVPMHIFIPKLLFNIPKDTPNPWDTVTGRRYAYYWNACSLIMCLYPVQVLSLSLSLEVNGSPDPSTRLYAWHRCYVCLRYSETLHLFTQMTKRQELPPVPSSRYALMSSPNHPLLAQGAKRLFNETSISQQIFQQPCALLEICEYQSHPKVQWKTSNIAWLPLL